MANPDFATNENGDDFHEEGQVVKRLSGWRIERNANGYYRWRWQIRQADGRPDTYIMTSGATGYRRGSRYLPRLQALQELEHGKKK